MNQCINRILQILIGLLVFGSAQASISSFKGDPVASNDDLDKMRGGFEVDVNGMRLLMAFSIESFTYINGALVSSMKLNPLEWSQIDSAVGAITSSSSATSLAPVTQQSIMSPISVTSSPSTAAREVTTATPPMSASTPSSTSVTLKSTSSSIPLVSTPAIAASDVTAVAPAISSSAPATQQSATSSVPPVELTQLLSQLGAISVVQNGVGNTFILPQSLSSLSTVIQNSVNNQVIQNFTVMNLTLAVKQAAAQMALSSALNQAMSGLAR